MKSRVATAVGDLVSFVALSERRRLLVVVGIPVLFVALFELTANRGALVVLLAVGLATYLYTRPTPQETVAASAYATGALIVTLFLLELYWGRAGGSTESMVGTATRFLWRLIAGTSLLGLGLWLRRMEV